MTVAQSLVIALLGLWLAADQRPAADKRQPQEQAKASREIEVKITFSVKELDPKQPGDSHLTCTVRNRRQGAIRVPTVYRYGFDTEMLLYANSYPGPPVMRMFSANREKKKQEYATLEAGKEITIFKAPLKALLKLTPEDPKKQTLVWSWEA